MIGLGMGCASPARPAAPPFTPASLSPTAWYSGHAIGNFWQDSARTVAGVVGQPIGSWTDSSGSVLHGNQATTAAKPILRLSGSIYYAELDGVDDYLQSTGIGTLAVGTSPASIMTIAKLVTAGSFPQLATYGRNLAGKSRGQAGVAAGGAVGVSFNADDYQTAIAWNVVRDSVADFTTPANSRAEVYVDNGGVTTFNPVSAYSLDGANTIILGVSPGLIGPGNFDVYDVVFRNGTSSATDRTNYRAYRVAKGI